uniref:Uncharacterized protein n=1 Tax=Arundo donax TaxID=35708 RepID=A0A0A8XTD6_ARUDO
MRIGMWFKACIDHVTASVIVESRPVL